MSLGVLLPITVDRVHQVDGGELTVVHLEETVHLK